MSEKDPRGGAEPFGSKPSGVPAPKSGISQVSGSASESTVSGGPSLGASCSAGPSSTSGDLSPGPQTPARITAAEYKAKYGTSRVLSAASSESPAAVPKSSNSYKRTKKRGKGGKGQAGTTGNAGSSKAVDKNVDKTNVKKRPRSSSALATSNLTPENKAPKFSDGGTNNSLTEVDDVAKQLHDSTLGPLSKEEEERAMEDALSLEKGEEASKPVSYANVASKKAKGVLRYVLTADRKPISKETNEKLGIRVEQAFTLEFLASGALQVPVSRLWSSFKEGRGLIAFADEDSAKIYNAQLTKVQLHGTRFRLWSRAELEPLRLLRGPLPEFARTLTKDQLSQLLLRQNNLPGSFKDIREVESTGKGGGKSAGTRVSLSCSCDEVLWTALNGRKFGSKSVMLRLGLDAGSVYTLQSTNKSEASDAAPSGSDEGTTGKASGT